VGAQAESITKSNEIGTKKDLAVSGPDGFMIMDRIIT
jgi:hypothetical protein